MIPVAAEISIRNHRQRDLEFKIPLVLLWILLSPLAVVLLPLFLIACLVGDISPYRAIAALWGILSGLTGTEVRVEQPDSSVYIHLY
jgi:hypothetical protein